MCRAFGVHFFGPPCMSVYLLGAVSCFIWLIHGTWDSLVKAQRHILQVKWNDFITNNSVREKMKLADLTLIIVERRYLCPLPGDNNVIIIQIQITFSKCISNTKCKIQICILNTYLKYFIWNTTEHCMSTSVAMSCIQGLITRRRTWNLFWQLHYTVHT